MRVPKNEIPVKIDVPGATARQLDGFGEMAGYGTMGAEFFSLGAGTDMAPLLKGLGHDMCHSPHWGYVISGEIAVTYRDGGSETAVTGDVFYWPPYHTVRADKDTEMVLFSPQHEHGEVIAHVREKLAG